MTFPRYILIQTVSFCNAHCMICPYDDTVHVQDQGYMDETIFKKIVDEASAHHGCVKQIMPYLMNEPLLDKNLVQKIEYIHQKNPQAWIHIVTNGILLDDETTESLLRSPLHSIKISMLAHRKETYEKVMGVANYDIALKRIVRFVETAQNLKGDAFVSICLTNTPGCISQYEIEEAKKFWEQKGVSYEIIPQPISRAGNVRMVKRVWQTHIIGCRSIWRDEMIHILFNGDVILCCMDWKREVVVGNVREQTIEEIWNSKQYGEIRKIIAGTTEGNQNFLCYRCEEAKSTI
ncbi:MAG: SPASM domain-containing protein [Candidatus Omnitrophica bacterium]|nr:SPASM domain-containing protein [Candidatus Omnitrophota bacterium]